MAQQCQLWMGSLESYMTENFILAAFRKLGLYSFKTGVNIEILILFLSLQEKIHKR